jgi:AcrR family transcriptional regulator
MDTREKIRNAALQVFAETGERGATTRRIAAAAGVNEVTIFRYFGSKEVLLREALAASAEGVLGERLPETPGDPLAELTRWARVHLEAMHRAAPLLRASMAEHEANPALSAPACEVPTRVSADLASYLARLERAGLVPPLDHAASAAALLMGALFSDAVSRDLMPDRYPLPAAAAAERYVALFLRGVGWTGAATEPDSDPGTGKEEER